MNPEPVVKHRNERGTALITAIGFIAVLSILGSVVLTTSTRDLGLTGSFTPTRQSFYTADRTVEYAMNRDVIINLAPMASIDLGDASVDALNSDGVSLGISHKEIIEAGAGGTVESATLEDLGPRDLPPAMAAIHGTDFGANLYHVQVKAEANSSSGPIESRIDASIVRLFKIDDDTIFRTSGGG